MEKAELETGNPWIFQSKCAEHERVTGCGHRAQSPPGASAAGLGVWAPHHPPTSRQGWGPALRDSDLHPPLVPSSVRKVCDKCLLRVGLRDQH